MSDYSLEKAKQAAQSIMQSWADAEVWPVDEWYQVGPNWKLRLFLEGGKRIAILYEVKPNGYLIEQSATWLPIPEKGGEG